MNAAPPEQAVRGWSYVFAILLISTGTAGLAGIGGGLIAAGLMIGFPVSLGWIR